MTEQLPAAKSSLAERWVEPAFQLHARLACGRGSEVAFKAGLKVLRPAELVS